MQPHALVLIQDLATLMLVAGVISILCNRYKQPIVLGYILAGIIIGPHTPAILSIHDEASINTLAELGIIFLMFALGLEFNLHKLSKVGWPALIAALLEISLLLWLGYALGQWFGWSQIDSIFLGAILSISSTTIIVKALDELGLKQYGFAQLIFGILIIEDIFAIIILAILSGIATTGALEVSDVALAVTQLISFLVVSLVLGILFVPRLLAYIARFNNAEMLLITVLALCFGFCLIVIKLQYSIALGAFVIGAIIAESAELKLIQRLIMPLRDMFCAIFFVSVGLLFDPSIFMQHLMAIVIITLAVIIGKVITCSLGTLASGRDGHTAMQVGLGLAQIGEFSFIIASLGISLHVTSKFLYPIAVAVSAITTLSTPYLIKHATTMTRLSAYLIPATMSRLFGYYQQWITTTFSSSSPSELTHEIKFGLLQITINLFIVTAIFLSSTYVATTTLGHIMIIITNRYMQKTIIWTAALILSLPFLIACYRKMKHIGLLLAIYQPSTRNKMLAETLPILTLIGMMLFIFLLSARIVPPLELVVIILLCVSGLGFSLRLTFIRWHERLHQRLLHAIKKHPRD